jgi:hypothetical protein
MIFHRKPMEVDAVLLKLPMEFNGKKGGPGDYFVTFADGSMTIMAKRPFENMFSQTEVATVIPAAPAELITMAELEKQEAIHSKFICMSCNNEVMEADWERKTGMCVECLKLLVNCNTCGKQVNQYEIIGSMCRHCLKGS